MTIWRNLDSNFLYFSQFLETIQISNFLASQEPIRDRPSLNGVMTLPLINSYNFYHFAANGYFLSVILIILVVSR